MSLNQIIEFNVFQSQTIQNIENQLNDTNDQYWNYYNQMETIRELDEQNEQKVTERITIFGILWPLVMAVGFGSISITVLLIVCCICCVLMRVDWVSLCMLLFYNDQFCLFLTFFIQVSPFEYLPYFNYKLLHQKLQLCKNAGVYVREDGTKEYYEPIVNEEKIYKQIEQSLYSNC